MSDYRAHFARCIDECRAGIAVYRYLAGHVAGPLDYSDLLRGQIVGAVSALDYLIHELVIAGIMDSVDGSRRVTAALAAQAVRFDVVQGFLIGEGSHRVLLEGYFRARLKEFSYQSSENISKGLSLVWGEGDKWEKIAALLGREKKSVVTQLDLIVSMRNRIVHEADFDPLYGKKYRIEDAEVLACVEFIAHLGSVICNLVEQSGAVAILSTNPS